MTNRTHTYDLSFVSPARKKQKPPEIVFSINAKHLPELRKRLDTIISHNCEHVDGYFFSLPDPDLFNYIEFGYEKCGYCTKHKNTFKFHIELRPNQRVFHCTQTIKVLSEALLVPFDQQIESSLIQQVKLITIANSSYFYGHAVSGILSQSVTTWLSNYAKSIISKHPQGTSTFNMHPDVIRAMKQTCRSIHTSDNKMYLEECSGYIRTEGHFTLICSGNSCDLSVYPDQNISKGEFVDLECHNLDNAHQQLTLLSGIAKICELTRKDT